MFGRAAPAQSSSLGSGTGRAYVFCSLSMITWPAVDVGPRLINLLLRALILGNEGMDTKM